MFLSQEEISQYGIDWTGPANTEVENLVEVPDTPCPLNDNKLQLLLQNIDPTLDDGNYGIPTLNDIVSTVTSLFHNQNW